MNKKMNNVFFNSALILIIALVVGDRLLISLNHLLRTSNLGLETTQRLLALDIIRLYAKVAVLLIVLYKARERLRDKSLVDISSIDIVQNCNNKVFKNFVLLGYIPYLLVSTVFLIVFPSTMISELLNVAILATITISYLYQVVTNSHIGYKTIVIYVSIAVGLGFGDYIIMKLFWVVIAWAETSITDYSSLANLIIIASKSYSFLFLLWSAISIVIKVKVLSKLLPIHSDDQLTTE